MLFILTLRNLRKKKQNFWGQGKWLKPIQVPQIVGVEGKREICQEHKVWQVSNNTLLFRPVGSLFPPSSPVVTQLPGWCLRWNRLKTEITRVGEVQESDCFARLGSNLASLFCWWARIFLNSQRNWSLIAKTIRFNTDQFSVCTHTHLHRGMGMVFVSRGRCAGFQAAHQTLHIPGGLHQNFQICL